MIFAAVALIAAASVAQAVPVRRTYGAGYKHGDYGYMTFGNKCAQATASRCKLTACSEEAPAAQMFAYTQTNYIKVQAQPSTCMVVDGEYELYAPVVPGACTKKCTWEYTAGEQYQLVQAPQYCMGYKGSNLCLVECEAAPVVYYQPATYYATPAQQPAYQAVQQPAYGQAVQQPAYGYQQPAEVDTGYGYGHGNGYGRPSYGNGYGRPSRPSYDDEEETGYGHGYGYGHGHKYDDEEETTYDEKTTYDETEEEPAEEPEVADPAAPEGDDQQVDIDA